ncbi:Lid2 complex component snt2 [Lachnellula suecica]|uniref:Lid2 complex component snt2 n=1 Tax=Lachnellula suecica TaxID=602035 RepID=A0A8T9CCA9_9HELO|nr:Lid2 complex component snt2 [Lachnellula suecica]
MTKETSRRSSAAGSAHSPSRSKNGDGKEVLETQQLGDALLDGTPKTSSRQDSDVAAVTNAPEPGAAVSQPMSASLSNSSNRSLKDATGIATGSAAPYGTRSRNRTGTSRPNYAEDKELDAEFEVAPAAKENLGRKARATDTGASDAGKPTGPGRKAPAAGPEGDQAAQNHHRDPIPGTSTFSANPTVAGASTQASKKRKAAAQSTANQPQQAPSQSTLPVQTVTRRTSMAAQVAAGFRETNMLSFENCAGHLKGKKLVADDGTILEVNDHVYLVCEPPGEPYYLGRIMEFLHVNNDNAQPIDALRLNWYYRPKDIGRKVNDTRQVFASMHSDISPLTALRGKCQIQHKSEVAKIDDLRKMKDCFWYEKLYDRYIHRFYDVIPTSQVINVPIEVKKVLDERWRYIVVEPGRGKELTSAVKSCKRCNKYCASNDSVDCAVCKNTYHMSCVNPPLLKKPSRGFAWACGPCSKAQEKKLEARNTPNVTDVTMDAEDEENNDDEEDSSGVAGEILDTDRTSSTVSNGGEVSIHPGTAEQIHQASLWLFRYLGIHCKVEDALDYDDRIYPRASSRLGPRHQANVSIWPGRPVEYVKPVDIKRKYMKGSSYKKDTKLAKETVAALEADKVAREKRPKWVMDEPSGYVHRGEDYDNDDPRNTARLLYKLPEAGQIIFNAPEGSNGKYEPPDDSEESERENFVYQYLYHATGLANPNYHLPERSTNVLDVALESLQSNGYDFEKASQAMQSYDKKVFKEPDLSPAELKKFEDGVAKYGSEWHSIKKHVKTVSAANIVRFYYTWKKTERGKLIWGNYSGRKGKKEAKRAEATSGKLQDDVADEYDDSAFDNDKAFEKKWGFQCKFCDTRSCRQWRRAPNTPAGTTVTEPSGTKSSGKDKSTQFMVALCQRCAELWRRYAIQWEDIDEMARKVAQGGSKAWRRKVDEELLKELVAANELIDQSVNAAPVPSLSTGGTPAPATANASPGIEPPRKKVKGVSEKESTDPSLDSGVVTSASKKKVAPENPLPPPGPPPVPEPPKAKLLPCAICGQMDPMGDQHVSCKECRLTVHRNCYGIVSESRTPSKWVCDMCSNDKNPQVSIQYKCMLCPVEFTEHDFVEPPKISHKKKSDKEREREKVERENALKVADYFRKKQEELNKPVNPREPLKRTANNNWVHVTCAVFTPEVKFGNAKALEPSEGIPSIASARYDEICKACKQKGGACVACFSCRSPVHVGCAHQAGYILGFDIAPVKGSRRDQVNIVDIHGEVGAMTAAIWCKEHVPTKTIVHRMHDIVDETGLNALQLYVQNFKQADLTLTGTVRKATLVNQSTKVINASAAQTPNRKGSTTTGANGHPVPARNSISHTKSEENSDMSSIAGPGIEKICATCRVDVSPKWWPFPRVVYKDAIANSDQQDNGDLVASNGSVPVDSLGEDNDNHAALAAAALHQNTQVAPIEPTEFQCHQCHWKKVQRESTPPPPAIEQEPSGPPIGVPPPTTNAATPDADPTQSIPQYAWPAPPSYPSNGPYNNWARHSPVSQSVALVNQLNGNHSPVTAPVAAQPLNGHTQVRQSGHNQPRSPQQNGHNGHVPNSYPPSPHGNISSSTLHMPNGNYASYTSPLPAQHLTNGGPPPRAPEHPFGNTPMHSRSSFGPPHGSPPLHRDSHPQARDTPQPNNVRHSDGRVNGGASASPSLRNLLS